MSEQLSRKERNRLAKEKSRLAREERAREQQNQAMSMMGSLDEDTEPKVVEQPKVEEVVSTPVPVLEVVEPKEELITEPIKIEEKIKSNNRYDRVFRYEQLDNLVKSKHLSTNAAYELSFLTEEEQEILIKAMKELWIENPRFKINTKKTKSLRGEFEKNRLLNINYSKDKNFSILKSMIKKK